MGQLYLGTSGFSYADWRGKFYPRELSPRQWLEFYSQQFNSLEINSTFYHLPRRATFANWYRRTPVDFRFAIKAPRRLTHFHRFNIDPPLWQWFWQAVQPLREKLAVILWQLPPSFQLNFNRLQQFLDRYAQTARFAFEFRHPSWFQPPVYQLLRQHNASLVWHDAQAFPQPPRQPTADFVYLRFHGVEILYNYEYSRGQLAAWAEIIRQQLERRDVFAYFNNDPDAFAPKNARELANLLQQN